MSDDWVDIRRQARQDIHAAFAVSASYNDSTLIAPIAEIHVRWHDRFTAAIGDVVGGEYARIFENIDRILFDPVELAAKGFMPIRGGTVTLTKYGYSFKLDVQEPIDGPDKISWTVMKP